MNRLIQGDVGSGKTVIATIAMYATFLGGFQSALMAPTENTFQFTFFFDKRLNFFSSTRFRFNDTCRHILING